MDLTFRQSSVCPTGNPCVQVAFLPNEFVILRRTAGERRPMILSPDEWLHLTQGIKAGEFDPS